MRYKLKCKCGATAWQRGSFDPSVNALELDDNDLPEWEGGLAECAHERFEVVDEESDDEGDV